MKSKLVAEMFPVSTAGFIRDRITEHRDAGIGEKVVNEVTTATQLHINERLFEKGLITNEMYMKAKERFLQS